MIMAIILGALIGWIASIITGNNKKMGAIANIIVGILGSSIGNFISTNLGIVQQTFTQRIIFGVLGAVILLFFLGLFFNKK